LLVTDAIAYFNALQKEKPRTFFWEALSRTT
jgi:hypothetical protein